MEWRLCVHLHIPPVIMLDWTNVWLHHFQLHAPSQCILILKSTLFNICYYCRRPLSQFLCLRDPHQCPPFFNVFSEYDGYERGAINMSWPVTGSTYQSTPNRTLFAYCAMNVALPSGTTVLNRKCYIG